MNDNKSLTPPEVAEILRITKNTVYELIKRGELNAYKVGKKVRVEQKDVEDYKNRRKNKSGSKLNDSALRESISSSHIFSNVDSAVKNEFIICGQDQVLDILSRHLETHPNGIRALRSYIGSYNGLFALYQGEASVATCHLWDGDTGEYNIPYIKRMLPGIPCVAIHLAYRMQGFYVKKGNPKNITGWNDLKRSDITIVNREKGSGSRVLLDENLRLLGIYGSKINGYKCEYTSHLAVASAVSRGDADFGLGNQMASLSIKDIEFIPIQQESYDLVIKREDFDKPPFQAIYEIINSKEFKAELEGFVGYSTESTGKTL